MSRPTCASGNGEPTREGHTLGPSASWDLEVALGDVPWLDEQLEITLTRQGATTPGGFTTGSRERPLPLHVGAAQVRSEMRATLVGWVRDLHETHGAALPDDTVPDMARWMLSQRAHIETHEAAGEIWREVTSVVAHARRLIDRPPVSEFVGVCDGAEDQPCGAALYAQPKALATRCEGCGESHAVSEVRDGVRARVEDRLATTTEIARAVVWVGEHVKPDAIRVWAARGRLEKRGTVTVDGRERPVYRIGDVLDLLVSSERKAS